MAQKDTVERILDAAEQLFSEKGFAEPDGFFYPENEESKR